MKKMNQKGFGVLELFLVTVVLGLIGFSAYYFYSRQNNDKDDNNTALSSQEQSPETTNTLQAITSFYRSLNPEILNDQDESIGVDSFIRQFDDNPQLRSITIKSDIYAEFEGDATPLQEQMIKGLTDNGLSLNGEINTSSLIGHEAEYTSDNALCRLYVSKFYGRLNCISSGKYELVVSNVAGIASVINAAKNINAQGMSVKWFEGQSSVYGASVYYSDSIKGDFYPTTYLAKNTSDWRVIAENSKGAQSEIPATCKELQHPDLNGLFAKEKCA